MTKQEPSAARRALILAGAVALTLTAPASAHMLGGGGRPAASASASSDNSAQGKAWTKLDPPADSAQGGASGQPDASVGALIDAARARCDSLDPGARDSCYRQAAAAAVAAGYGSSGNTGTSAAAGAEAAAAPTKLDELRAAEAVRLKAQRARCDAESGARQQACYDELSASHEKWHEKYDPMPDEGSKMGPLTRAQCYKLHDAKKQRQCLRALYKSKRLLH